MTWNDLADGVAVGLFIAALVIAMNPGAAAMTQSAIPIDPTPTLPRTCDWCGGGTPATVDIEVSKPAIVRWACPRHAATLTQVMPGAPT